MNKERNELTGKFTAQHGHRKLNTPTYRSWEAMLHRCNNPKAWNYKYYGARGITVCKRWLKFTNFLADMGERPEGRTLDRKNVNENYCKSNCKWATRSEQQLNKRPTDAVNEWIEASRMNSVRATA